MKKIAILHRGQPDDVESFINVHKEHLEGDILFLSGGEIPTDSSVDGNISSFVERSWVRRIGRLLPVFLYSRVFPWKTPSSDLEFYLAKKNIDIVLAEYGTTAATNLRVLKKLNLPLIVHFHGFDASNRKVLESYEKKYRAMFDYSRWIVVVSRAMEKAVLKMGCPKEKIVLCPYGPDDRYFEIAPTFNAKRFVSIGRFVDKKAPYYVLAAFKEVIKKHPDAELVMVGDGYLRNTIENLANFWGVKKNLTFPGQCSGKEIRHYLNECLAFVQHSVVARDGDSEGTPVAILEASAAGVPVISTKHAGISDVVIHGETGLLLEEHNVSEMANCMNLLCDNFALAEQLGKNARNRVLENFSLEKHINTLNSLLT